MTVALIFHALEGQWEFHREIPSYGVIKGLAKFQKLENDEQTLHYREDGELCVFQGKKFTVFREYLYHFQDEKICVFFKEKPQRFMYSLEFISSLFDQAKARYICNCDIYEATYRFHLPTEFSLSYSIQGPRKSYFIHSNFKRFL